MNEMEKAPQDLFQELSQFMELRGIRCIFEVRYAGEPDSKALLTEIAQCLQKDTSDYDCIEEIIALLEINGFPTSPRHDSR